MQLHIRNIIFMSTLNNNRDNRFVIFILFLFFLFYFRFANVISLVLNEFSYRFNLNKCNFVAHYSYYISKL